MKIKTTIATDSPDQLGITFSKEALKKISDEAPGTLLKFEHGWLPLRVVKAEELDGRVDVELDWITDFYVVPSFRKEGEEFVLDHLSLTNAPCDFSLESLKGD